MKKVDWSILGYGVAEAREGMKMEFGSCGKEEEEQEQEQEEKRRRRGKRRRRKKGFM